MVVAILAVEEKAETENVTSVALLMFKSWTTSPPVTVSKCVAYLFWISAANEHSTPQTFICEPVYVWSFVNYLLYVCPLKS